MALRREAGGGARAERPLTADVLSCRACPLGGLGLPRCVGWGTPSAEVAVVGINPSVRAPAVDRGAFALPLLAAVLARGEEPRAPAGSPRAAWALARAAGLEVRRVYSTNAVKCATPGNRAPSAEEVRTCWETHLRTELAGLLNLRRVLILGKVAGAVLGLSSFGQRRTLEDTIAEGTLLRHPVSVLRRWTALEREARRWAEAAGASGPARP